MSEITDIEGQQVILPNARDINGPQNEVDSFEMFSTLLAPKQKASLSSVQTEEDLATPEY